jgi:hypothetical protein
MKKATSDELMANVYPESERIQAIGNKDIADFKAIKEKQELHLQLQELLNSESALAKLLPDINCQENAFKVKAKQLIVVAKNLLTKKTINEVFLKKLHRILSLYLLINNIILLQAMTNGHTKPQLVFNEKEKSKLQTVIFTYIKLYCALKVSHSLTVEVFSLITDYFSSEAKKIWTNEKLAYTGVFDSAREFYNRLTDLIDPQELREMLDQEDSEETQSNDTVMRAVFGAIGALLGAAIGGVLGGFLGSLCAGYGAIPGAFIGALLGALAGAALGVACYASFFANGPTFQNKQPTRIAKVPGVKAGDAFIAQVKELKTLFDAEDAMGQLIRGCEQINHNKALISDWTDLKLSDKHKSVKSQEIKRV